MKVVVGLGLTGVSCIDYLRRLGDDVIAMDGALQPAGLDTIRARYPDLRCIVGGLDKRVLAQADEIIISPGVPIEKVMVASHVPIIGDIELLARATNKPVYAITGSNGKTTVTTLVGAMAQAAQAKMAVAGNIGTPVLDFLSEEASQSNVKGFILELSSFQLETTYSLKPKAATILNVTPDHLDRYRDIADYLAAKQRIYHHCDIPILNADEAWMYAGLPISSTALRFSVKTNEADYYVESQGNDTYLVRRGERLLAASDMVLQGIHHWQNALAALAFGEVMQLPLTTMLDVLRRFTGLDHRCQWVRSHQGVDWYNDSKATNVGATETAINSLGPQTTGHLVLIGGGLGKGADFSVLQEPVKRFVSHLILMGQDAPQMAEALHDCAEVHRVKTIQEAVKMAHQLAQPGDKVLLAPACASLDMFQNYGDRGNQFVAAVNAL
jgi:UDP-N-acetylmuramoylalanine--D-glutamate ligase